MEMPVTFIKLEQTCIACPSQWDAEDTEGNSYYIRYRWGFLSVTKNGLAILEKELGDGLDGFLEEHEMLKVIGAVDRRS